MTRGDDARLPISLGCRTLLEPYIDLYEQVILTEVGGEISEDDIIRVRKRTEAWFLRVERRHRHPALTDYAMLLCCYYHGLTELQKRARSQAIDVMLPTSARCHDLIRLTRSFFRKDDSLLLLRL